jgi:hypothetical protein
MTDNPEKPESYDPLIPHKVLASAHDPFKEIARQATEILELGAETKRLRAALERIVTGHHAEPVQEIAHRALEGK